MYLDSVHLHDLKCFPDLKVKFRYRMNSGDPGRNWNVIVGVNGEGKTSLLRAITACLLDRSAAEICLKPSRWVREGSKLGTMSIKVVPNKVDQRPWTGPASRHPVVKYVVVDGPQEIEIGERKQFFSTATLLEPHLERDPPVTTGRGEVLSANFEFMKRNAFLREPNRGWLCCAFGAHRRLSGAARSASPIEDPLVERVATLFDDDAVLTDCEIWLKELDRRAAKSEPGSQHHGALEDVKAALCRVLPRVDEVLIGDEVELRFQGARSRLSDLSDGYRSMFGLAVDILRWIAWAHPGTKSSLPKMRGVVLIDEIDAHLHPRWQRKVGSLLTKAFPNLQFIVTTHSPFVAMEAGAGAVTVLKKRKGAVYAEQGVPDVRGWAVDRVLTELFDLPSLRDPKTTQDLKRYQELRLKSGADALAEGEGDVLAKLEERLKERTPPDIHGSWALEQDLNLLAKQLQAKNGVHGA